ncbi:MAG: DUF1653 domain-containing protein [Eubacteriales bacterium]
MRHIPKAGDQYKHFKGGQYEIITTALHSETLEEQVVYRQMASPHDAYVRPLWMFLEEVDKEKYPDVAQHNRFELLTGEKDEEEVPELLLQFFDESTYTAKAKVLESMKNIITEQMLNSMSMSTDIVLPEGELEEQYEEFRNCLSLRGKFERDR